MDTIGLERVAPALSAQISAPGNGSTLATALSTEASAVSMDDVNVTHPEYIPGIGISTFEWDMINLSGWAEDYRCPSS